MGPAVPGGEEENAGEHGDQDADGTHQSEAGETCVARPDAVIYVSQG